MNNSRFKFRAWDIEGKCWIPEQLCRLGFKGDLYTFDDLQEESDIYLKETIQYMICQYSGLKDKNNKEIYEGDILRGTGIDGRVTIWECKDLTKFHHWQETEDLICEFGDIEIIGNVYENKELLK